MKKSAPILAVHANRREIVVHEIEEAKREMAELEKAVFRLRSAIVRKQAGLSNPVIRMLNRHLKTELMIVIEWFSSYRATSKNQPGHFVLNRKGEAAFGIMPDAPTASRVDRVYVVRLDGPSELLYERQPRSRQEGGEA